MCPVPGLAHEVADHVERRGEMPCRRRGVSDDRRASNPRPQAVPERWAFALRECSEKLVSYTARRQDHKPLFYTRRCSLPAMLRMPILICVVMLLTIGVCCRSTPTAPDADHPLSTSDISTVDRDVSPVPLSGWTMVATSLSVENAGPFYPSPAPGNPNARGDTEMAIRLVPMIDNRPLEDKAWPVTMPVPETMSPTLLKLTENIGKPLDLRWATLSGSLSGRELTIGVRVEFWTLNVGSGGITRAQKVQEFSERIPRHPGTALTWPIHSECNYPSSETLTRVSKVTLNIKVQFIPN
jgi:hypothetical protein